MTRSPIGMARFLAILMLAGSVTAASAQADNLANEVITAQQAEIEFLQN